MLVAHMDSGLGNQMLDYAEYLAIKKANPDKKCYIENIVYEIPCEEGMFSVWNGYELKKIFNIDLPNIKETFSDEDWKDILNDVRNSRFWEEEWDYSPHIVEAFSKRGLVLHDLGKRPPHRMNKNIDIRSQIRKGITFFFGTPFGYHVKRYARKVLQNHLIKKENEKYDIYRVYPDDSFVGHSFKFKYKGFGIEKIDKEIREAFRFPAIVDKMNLDILEKIKATNSVSIHARRSDLLFLNGHCYVHGYFKRSVRYIKKKVNNPVFFFFTDEYSVGWCEENPRVFGIDFENEEVHFVTWNKGENSYIDMYLMSMCKHNIFTESTFGFWGAYLNENPNKITCAPDVTILATNSF